MKESLLILTLFFSTLLTAQTVDIKDATAGDEETTTIEIKKGKKSETKAETKPENKWEVQDGTADVEGESAATNKEAKASWSKACTEWKKEFRTDNKDNKILSMACGSASCGGDAGSKVCTSKATYKIKTLMN